MFWGWGREDDELFQRMKEAGMSVSNQYYLKHLRGEGGETLNCRSRVVLEHFVMLNGEFYLGGHLV